MDHPVWQHRITIYQPEPVTTATALLYINGGILYSESGKQLTIDKSPNDDLHFAEIAAITHSVVIDLKDIPNQFLQFVGQEPMKEDALVAYTWSKFIEAPSENYYLPLRLPIAITPSGYGHH